MFVWQREILKFFDVDPTMLPIAVFVRFSENTHAPVIGKFDEDTIRNHEIRFKMGKLAMHDVIIDLKGIQISDINCKAVMAPEGSNDDIDGDLLELAEDEITSKKKASNSAKGKTKGKKGVKGKGAKKKKK